MDPESKVLAPIGALTPHNASMADTIARAFWDASRRRDPLLPRWEGLAVDLRRNRVADYQTMLDAGWVFTPPE